MTEREFDAQKAEAFGDRMMDMLNLGSLTLMTSIGHRTGLLGTMWGRELALEMLGEAGFSNVEAEQLKDDFQNEYFLSKK